MSDEWEPVVLVEDVKGHFESDGSLSAVTVQANYNEELEHRFTPDETDYNEDELEELAEKYDPGGLIDVKYRRGAYARVRFEIHDGVADLVDFKDAEPSDANWVGFDFLKILDPAVRVVEQLPRVERVESPGVTLGNFLEQGEEAGLEDF